MDASRNANAGPAYGGTIPDAQAICRALERSNCQRSCACHTAARRGHGKTHCPLPGHADKKPSLSVWITANDQVGVYCHVCGRAQQGALYDRLRELGLWPDRPRSRDHTSRRRTPNSGLTVAQFAQAKRLDLDLLQREHVSDFIRFGQSSVRFAYLDPQGEELAIRYRIGIGTGDDFRWKERSQAVPYGQQHLGRARRAGYIVGVEGESDTLTLWQHDFEAIGFPGAGTFQEDRDAPLFDGIAVIYLVIEPDKGGDAVLGWLSTSRIRDRVRIIVMPPGQKDPNDLYRADPARFRERFRTLIDAAVPYSTHDAAMREKQRAAAWAGCERLARKPSILAALGASARRRGLVGESRTARLSYLVIVSRASERPVSLILKGPSSVGKNFIVKNVAPFFPDRAYWLRTSLSEHGLIYNQDSFVHRTLMFVEAASLENPFTEYIVRALLSEGRIVHETTETTPQLHGRTITKEGPANVIVTTTAVSINQENETRFFSATLDDSPEQTKRIIDEAAVERDRTVDTTPWHALADWLDAQEFRVVIPYAERLVALIPPVAVRLRRDVPAVLELIRAHAHLHRATRKRNAEGATVAQVKDYAVVRRLVGDLIAEGVNVSVSKKIRETVAAVIKLGGADVTIMQLAKALRIDRSSAQRRYAQARDAGYLKNTEKPGVKARVALDEPLPENIAILPNAAALDETIDVDVEIGG
jgi:hypothetical protein